MPGCGGGSTPRQPPHSPGQDQLGVHEAVAHVVEPAIAAQPFLDRALLALGQLPHQWMHALARVSWRPWASIRKAGTQSGAL
jgi:hypothetical protein